MSPTKRSEHQAEFENEQEVDFGRYLRALARGWRLLLAGLVIGAVLAIALTLGGGDFYQGKATIYLGQPTAVNSATPIQSLSTNPSTVTQLAHATDVLSQVSKSSGLPLKKLSAGVSTATVKGYLSKLGQTPLVVISVQAKAPQKAVTDAANALASLVLARVSKYPNQKIAILHTQIASCKRQIKTIDERLHRLNVFIANGSGSPVDYQVLLTQALSWEQRRAGLTGDVESNELFIAQAKTVEQGSIVSRAEATKTTGRDRKNALVVGSALGLLVGALAALALPGPRRRRVG
jgi:uncharacterized protein involved in exopolysaccharide biosynthesis